MTITGWIIASLLLLVVVLLVTQFGRLLIYLLKFHREERREASQRTTSALQTLEAAIREASGKGTTNIFQADKQQNQIGDENEQR